MYEVNQIRPYQAKKNMWNNFRSYIIGNLLKIKKFKLQIFCTCKYFSIHSRLTRFYAIDFILNGNIYKGTLQLTRNEHEMIY